MTRTYRLCSASHRKRTTITAPCTRESNGISGDWNDFILFSLFSAHDTTRLRLNGHTHTNRTRFLFASRMPIKIMSARSAVRRVFCGNVMGNTYLERKCRKREAGVIVMIKLRELYFLVYHYKTSDVPIDNVYS